MDPFQTRHRPQFRCMRLLARLLEHWPRANAIESSDLRMCWTKRYRADERFSTPHSRFDRADLLWINESRVRRQLRSAGCKVRLRLCSAEKNGKTDAVVQPDSTSFAACEHLTPATRWNNRPVTRNSSVLIRVIRGFKMRFIGVQMNSMSTAKRRVF